MKYAISDHDEAKARAQAIHLARNRAQALAAAFRPFGVRWRRQSEPLTFKGLSHMLHPIRRTEG